MAKMKVYELAKELGVENTELIDVLNSKGVDVKSYRNALEDDQVELARKSFSPSAKPKPQKPQPEQKNQEKEKENEGKAEGAKSAPAKKKKNIIFVSNPDNSRMKGAQVPRKPEPKPKPKQEQPRMSQPKAAEPKVAEPKVAESKVAEQKSDEKKQEAKENVKQPAQPNVEVKKPVEQEVKPVAAAAEQLKPVEAQKPVEAPKPEIHEPKQDAPKANPSDGNFEKRRNDNRNRDGQRNGGRDNNYRNDNRNRDGQRNGGRDNNYRGDRNNDRGNRDGQRNGGRDNNYRGDRNNDRNDRGNRDGQRNGGRDNNYRGDRNNDRNDNRNRDGQRGNYNGNNGGRRDDRQGERSGLGARPGQGFGGSRDNDRRNDNRDRGGNYNNGGRNQGRGGQPRGGFAPEAPAKDAEKHRDGEKRRIGQEKDKRNRKDFMYEEDENAVKNKNKAGRFIKPEKKPEAQQEEQIKVITLPESLTIKELADKMKIQPAAIIKKLFLQGQIVTVNQEIPYETAENIAIDYDIICEQEVKVDVIEELLREQEEDPASMVPRPPVICVMGHVDHGKTSLLDAIRKTNVTDKEAGGITQHIGAYTVNIGDRKITFLDTPGHEAFTAMRMRGANSTDIAILVVAADDGVMPQTVEAINHAKAAGIEIIVAVNKIDKPGANIERVKQELTEYELVAEDWGGSTVFVPVSAKSGEGIENLLEMILLTADMLELKANPNRRARGLVIEAELDKGRGPVATVLVQKGTLKVGDFVSAGAAHGKVRAMIDDKGRRVKEAGPSTPVEILGLGDVPNAGEIFIAHANEKDAKYYADTFIAQNKEKLLEDTKTKMSLDDLFSQIKAGNLKELNLIIKADVQGSVEAVKQSLMKLSNEEVVVKCIHGGVGAINESDVILASASNAIIIGFNVRPDAQAKATAEREGVDLRLYKVIYQAIEDIEAAMKGMLDPIYEEKVIGHAEVRQIFKASAVGNIAGSYVLDGMFQRDCKIRITREGEQIYEGQLASLKRFKDDVKEVKAGFECGLVFEGFDGMQELDIIEAYIMVEVPR